MDDIKNKLSGYVSEFRDIDAAYLFGSQASGFTHSESDVDVAFLFHTGKVPGAEHLLRIEDELTSLLKAKVDILVLNNTSPIIRMQVLRKGKKIYEGDHQAYLNFFVRTIKEYDDLKRIRSINEKSILRGRIYG